MFFMLIAASSEKKETTIRRKDFSGAKEWRGAVASISPRMVWRFGALKISMSRRFVISRVFEGGVG